jgi:DNA-binding CsgD family transcriptional regulator
VLDDRFTSVLGAGSADDFRDRVVAFAQSLEFDTVSATVVIDRTVGQAQFITVDNTPVGFREAFENLDTARRDPVMQHCKRSSVPIVWDQGTYTQQGQGDVWEEQARFGYRHGVAVALHLPQGKHFFVGVDRDRPIERADWLTRTVADLQLFAVHAQDAALRLLTPATTGFGTVALTPRELEALRWTMEGKTAWEVGRLLGISERTAALHLNNATHKLDCVNKHQAVLKALRTGLIG